jgi:hypothetical protein
MHAHAWGYVCPVPIFLTTAAGTTTGTYRPYLDGTAALLLRMGFKVGDTISGNLPFGCGFAGSTVLAMLHLADSVKEDDRGQIVHILEWIQHGFPPSGADYLSIRAQRPGAVAQCSETSEFQGQASASCDMRRSRRSHAVARRNPQIVRIGSERA